MLSLFELLSLLMMLTATFAWLNHRLLGLPKNIGLLVMGLAASLSVLAVELLMPSRGIEASVADIVSQVDLYSAVMDGMLAFLLFAGALHVDIGALRDRALGIAILATAGVAMSSLAIAGGLWCIGQMLGSPIAFAWALVFGTLIAPTDPVAVLSTMKAVAVPKTLATDLPGEALFNDGMAVVLFTIALQSASGSAAEPAMSAVALRVIVEAGGGAAIGLVAGWIAFFAMREIDEFSIEILISIALAMATYALANGLHTSGPIAVVVAGLLIGNRGMNDAMSERTQRYVTGFWTVIDDMLNAVLFLLIGLEVLVVRFSPEFWFVGALTIPVVLLSRFLSVSGLVAVLGNWQPFATGTVQVLTWGGVRGGISIALALALPAGAPRAEILAVTYSVVLFTLIVQGLTFEKVVRRATSQPLPDGEPSPPRQERPAVVSDRRD